jgi:hypothetical protein
MIEDYIDDLIAEGFSTYAAEIKLGNCKTIMIFFCEDPEEAEEFAVEVLKGKFLGSIIVDWNIINEEVNS